MPSRKTAIFISYASEDKDIADALENALNKIWLELLSELEIIRDIHSFEQGRSLKEEVYAGLERANILLIIYTDALKKSHSYTGAEIGAFEMLIRLERKRKDAQRKVVSLYLDNPPATESDIIGIKLNKLALAVSDPEARTLQLDPNDGLKKFLLYVSDLVLEQFYKQKSGRKPLSAMQIDDLAKQKMSKKKSIEDEILPELRTSVLSALSRLIETSSIEQKLITIKWRRGGKHLASQAEVLTGSEFVVPNSASSDVFSIFGLPSDILSMSWEEFKAGLADSYMRDAQYIFNSFDNAVRSAINTGPVDNEQFFLSPSGAMFRIIITRHYGYYDGSRVMHMYFIPIFPRFEKSDITSTLALLGVATKFRLLFLQKGGKLAPPTFRVHRHMPEKFKEKLTEFIRQFLLIEDESHVYGLDNPMQFLSANTLGKTPEEIATSFQVWSTLRDSLLRLAREVAAGDVESPNYKEMQERWISSLAHFCEEAESINRDFGGGAASELSRWFIPNDAPPAAQVQSPQGG